MVDYFTRGFKTFLNFLFLRSTTGFHDVNEIKTAPLLFFFIKKENILTDSWVILLLPGQHKVQANHFEIELCTSASIRDYSILSMLYNMSESHDKRICTNGLETKNRHEKIH